MLLLSPAPSCSIEPLSALPPNALDPRETNGRYLLFPAPNQLTREVITEASMRRDTCLGAGHVPLDGGDMLSVRLQIGGVQLLALLDPSDPDTHALRAGWARSGNARFGFNFSDGVLIMWLTGATDIGAPFEHYYIEPSDESGDWFLTNAWQTVFLGDLQRTAESDLEGVNLDAAIVYPAMTPRHQRLLANRQKVFSEMLSRLRH